MNKVFSFVVRDGNQSLEISNLDCIETATLCGFLLHQIYGSLSQASPMQASLFKKLMIDQIMHSESPLWKVIPREPQDGEINMVVVTDKEI